MKNFEWAKSTKMAAHNNLLKQANAYEDNKQRGLKDVAYLPDGKAVWVGQKHYYTAIVKEDIEGNATVQVG